MPILGRCRDCNRRHEYCTCEEGPQKATGIQCVRCGADNHGIQLTSGALLKLARSGIVRLNISLQGPDGEHLNAMLILADMGSKED